MDLKDLKDDDIFQMPSQRNNLQLSGPGSDPKNQILQDAKLLMKRATEEMATVIEAE